MSCSTGSTIARASSGSRSRINSVEPLMSANKAVTVLRSPSDAAESATVCSDVIRTDGVEEVRAVDLDSLEASAAAQSPQNFAVGAFSYPHLAQRFLKGAAHSLQNFCSARFSAPHVGQFTSRTQLVEQCLGVLEVGGVEAFGEPAVDFGEHRSRFIAAALAVEQARETHRCTQLQRFRALALSNLNSGAEAVLGFQKTVRTPRSQQVSF